MWLTSEEPFENPLAWSRIPLYWNYSWIDSTGVNNFVLLVVLDSLDVCFKIIEGLNQRAMINVPDR